MQLTWKKNHVFQQSCFRVAWQCTVIPSPTAISREKTRCTATNHVSSCPLLLSKQCTLLRKCPFSTSVKAQCESKEWCVPQNSIARVRIPQLQLPAQSQNGIHRNSDILIVIFQVNGTCLHQKLDIQLRAEPVIPYLTQGPYTNLDREVVCGFVVCFFFKRCTNFYRRCRPESQWRAQNKI